MAPAPNLPSFLRHGPCHTPNHLSLGSDPCLGCGCGEAVLGGLLARVRTSPLEPALLRHTLPLGACVCKVTAGGPERPVLGPIGERETH